MWHPSDVVAWRSFARLDHFSARLDLNPFLIPHCLHLRDYLDPRDYLHPRDYFDLVEMEFDAEPTCYGATKYICTSANC